MGGYVGTVGGGGNIANLDIQSSDISAVENRVREVIPVPDSLDTQSSDISAVGNRESER